MSYVNERFEGRKEERRKQSQTNMYLMHNVILTISYTASTCDYHMTVM